MESVIANLVPITLCMHVVHAVSCPFNTKLFLYDGPDDGCTGDTFRIDKQVAV